MRSDLRFFMPEFKKTLKKVWNHKLTLRAKLFLGFFSIAVTLLVSALISLMEYSSMSHYVSELIADDMSSISVANRLSEMSNEYNLKILAVVGDETSVSVPSFDDEYFKSHCDSLRMSIPSNAAGPLADSVMYSYSAYMLTSLELENVMQSAFIDSRTWYFERLQPRFDRLREDLNNLTAAIYKDLVRNSATFERGFYRSIVPGIFAVGVSLLLVFLLMFFVMTDYVNPLYKMLDALNAYRNSDKRYTYRFDGDDQMKELNDGISELASENFQLRSRIKSMKK